MSRLAVSCAVLFSATALAAACSVYDESLLGAGGDDSTSTRSGDGDGDGDGDGGRGGAGPTTTSDGSTSDASASTSDSSTGQSGSVTTGEQCQTPDDCPGQDSECSHRSCDGNQCSVLNEEAGFVLEGQTPGDCIVQICDGQGNVTSEVDDEDTATPTIDCVVPTCSNGIPGQQDAAEGDDCGGGFLCTADAECVECLGDGDCPENCNDNVCVTADCDDDEQNGDESDIDCGGAECLGCATGDACGDGDDCLSGVCTASTCRDSCTDNVLNNGETDIDCGGNNCDECPIGRMCATGGDCDSGLCLDTRCRPDLFFSEYVEGTSDNKAVEIFNYGNTALDLAATTCTVRTFVNGSTSSSSINLTGTLDPFDVHVLCRNESGQALLDVCDQESGLNHNGDDALAIDCGGVILDVFGQIGVDPGTAWGTGVTETANHTLRRKSSVTTGDRNGANPFDPSVEWDGFAVDTFAGLGVHP